MLTFLSVAVAGPTFTPSLQVRPRLEARSSSGGLTTGVSQRTRLGLTMEQGDVSVHAALQDVRRWGEADDTLKDFSADGLDLVHGWLAVRRSDWSLTVGRQPIRWHEERLIGTVAWTQQSRPLDGARLERTGDGVQFDAFAAVLRVPTDPVAGAWMGAARLGSEAVQGVVIVDLDDELQRQRATFGVYAQTPGLVSVRGEVYGQSGQVAERRIWAGLASLRVRVAPDWTWRPSISASADLLSGSGGPWTPFDTLLATNHKFYGQADIVWFQVGGPDGAGLLDTQLSVSTQPVEDVRVGLDAHVFSAPSDGYGRIGEEIDVYGRVPIVKKVWLAGGGALFQGRDRFDAWTWLQAEVKL